MKTEIDIFYAGGRPMESMTFEDADPEVHHRSVEAVRDWARTCWPPVLRILIVYSHGCTTAANALRQAPSAKRQAA